MNLNLSSDHGQDRHVNVIYALPALSTVLSTVCGALSVWRPCRRRLWQCCLSRQLSMEPVAAGSPLWRRFGFQCIKFTHITQGCCRFDGVFVADCTGCLMLDISSATAGVILNQDDDVFIFVKPAWAFDEITYTGTETVTPFYDRMDIVGYFYFLIVKFLFVFYFEYSAYKHYTLFWVLNIFVNVDVTVLSLLEAT